MSAKEKEWDRSFDRTSLICYTFFIHFLFSFVSFPSCIALSIYCLQCDNNLSMEKYFCLLKVYGLSDGWRLYCCLLKHHRLSIIVHSVMYVCMCSLWMYAHLNCYACLSDNVGLIGPIVNSRTRIASVCPLILSFFFSFFFSVPYFLGCIFTPVQCEFYMKKKIIFVQLLNWNKAMVLVMLD